MSRWPQKNLLEVARLTRGTEPGSGSYTDSSRGVRFLRVGDITGKTNNPAYTNAAQTVLVSETDVLLALDGSPGHISTGHSGAISSGLRKVEPIDPNKVSLDWLRYSLMSPDIQHTISKYTNGVTILHASSAVPHVSIPIPPVSEQDRIVKILDEAEELRRLRAEADHRTTNLIPSLFHEMFGDPLANLKRWDLATFDELTTFITSGSRGWAEHYSDRGALFIRVQNLAGHQLCFDDIAYVDPPATAEAKRTRILPNDLLLAITGNTIGLSALAPIDIGEAYVSQHVAIVRLNQTVSPVFIACYMALPRGGQYHIVSMQYGHTKPGISLQQIRDITIPLPPRPLQEEFAGRVTELRAMERDQATRRRRLDDLFQSLLHRAFQGEL